MAIKNYFFFPLMLIVDSLNLLIVLVIFIVSNDIIILNLFNFF